jgi:phosphoglycolate phosphatase
MLARRNLPTMDVARYRAIFDFPVERYYRAAGFDFSSEPFEVLADEFIREYNRRVTEASLHDGVATVLEGMRRAGVRQAVLSASRRHSLESAIAAYGISAHFTALQGLSDHFAVSKTEAGRELLEYLQIPARGPGDGAGSADSRALLIGDTTHDAEVATELGVDCVLIAAGHQSAARLRECGVPVYESLWSWFTA